ncbi:MAG: hypothetical protein ABGY96_07030 [bacterium]|nr:hypothetical protein [Gammaproteobacteria bacterium]HIL94887.1 hypothetical protein [Pseudomonadales bacterium]
MILSMLFPGCYLLATTGTPVSTPNSGNSVDSYLLQAEKRTARLVNQHRIRSDGSLSDWIESAEFRTGADNENERSYAVRFIPKTRGQRRVERSASNLMADKNRFEVLNALNNDLNIRYETLIDLFDLQVETEYITKRISLSEQNMTLYRSQINTAGFDAEKYQAIELEHLSLKQRLELSRQLQLEMKSSSGLGLDINSSSHIKNWSEWIPSITELVDEVAKNVNSAAQWVSLAQRSKALDLHLARENLNMSRVKDKALFSFIELKYTDRRMGQSELSMGVSIPMVKNNFNLRKRERQLNDAKATLANDQIVEEALYRRRFFALSQDRRICLSIEEAIADVDNRFSRLIVQEGSQLAINLKETRTRHEWLLKTTHLSALRSYLSLQHASGTLAKGPLRNWLESGFPVLKEKPS